MLIDLEELIAMLKSLGVDVYRNKAPTEAKFPYFVYTYVNEKVLFGSGMRVASYNQYQISYFTAGIESELLSFKHKFAGIPYEPFMSQQGDENDDTITNFYTYIDVRGDEDE